MSVLRADEDRDMQGARKDEESYLDCRNLPESRCESQKWEEAEARENPAPSAPSESLEPQDSDRLPSVFLAAFLALVFIVVSLLLLHHDPCRVCLDGCSRALSPSQAYLPESGLGPLRLLFPNQLEATWQALQRYVRGQLGGSHPDGSGILVAVGSGEASGTLLCLAKAALSFLTQERAVRVWFLEHGGGSRSSVGLREDGTCDLSAAEIYVGRNRVPSGLMVSLRSTAGGKRSVATVSLALLLNSTEQARKEFLLCALTPAFVSDILSAVGFAERTPETLMAANRSILVLLVKPEWYLEGDFVC